MSRKIKLAGMYQLSDAIRTASNKVVTSEGTVYANIPFWFEIKDDGEIVLHEETPEELSQFICTAGLGGDNPQIIKAKVW